MRILSGLVLLVLAFISIGMIAFIPIVSWILLALVVSYLLFSFTLVPVGKKGMLTLLERPIGDVGPGLQFTPLWLMSIRQLESTTIEQELPDDPENIFRDEDKAPVPPGKKPPIRIKFGQPRADDPKELADDPYNVPIVVEVAPFVRYHIPSPTKFFTTIGSIENLMKSMADLAEALFGEEFVKETPAKAAERLPEISIILKDRLCEAVKDWGVVVDSAQVKPFRYSHSFNKAVVGVFEERQNAMALVHKTEGEAKSKVLTAIAEQKRLLTNGLATTTGQIITITLDGGEKYTYEEIKLLPNAETQANIDIATALSKLTGTLVLGNSSTLLGLKPGGEQ